MASKDHTAFGSGKAKGARIDTPVPDAKLTIKVGPSFVTGSKYGDQTKYLGMKLKTKRGVLLEECKLLLLML